MMDERSQDSTTAVRLVAVGDVFLNRENPGESFAHVGGLLKAGDVTFGNSEGTYAVNQKADADMMAAIIASPDNIAALTAWLAQRGVTMGDLRAGRHTLEDVFLRLTGGGES